MDLRVNGAGERASHSGCHPGGDRDAWDWVYEVFEGAGTSAHTSSPPEPRGLVERNAAQLS
jgi:hypothetical protein